MRKRNLGAMVIYKGTAIIIGGPKGSGKVSEEYSQNAKDWLEMAERLPLVGDTLYAHSVVVWQNTLTFTGFLRKFQISGTISVLKAAIFKKMEKA